MLVPDAVFAEIEAGPGGGELAAELRENAMYEVISDTPVPIVVAAWDLGAGESQVLAQCLSGQGTTAVLDDRLARDCARSLGIPIIGTLGIVLAAKQRGWIPLARPVVEQLVARHMYLAPDLIRAALAEVGE